MKITICDLNPDVLAAWHSLVEPKIVDIHVREGSILDLECDAVVSPANSFGFMDGNLDYVYSTHFGWHVQHDLRKTIALRPFGELLVGEALMVPTGDPHIPYLISAPTMRVPKRIADAADIMLAARAAVAVARKNSLSHIAIPGMGTGCGEVRYGDAATATMAGIRAALGRVEPPRTWQEAQQRHFALEP